jgi:hypothetical protein
LSGGELVAEAFFVNGRRSGALRHAAPYQKSRPRPNSAAGWLRIDGGLTAKRTA